MILTQRERKIAIGAAILLGVVAVFGSLIHYIGVRRDIAVEMDSRQADSDRIDAIFKERDTLRKEYTQMVHDGLKNSQADAKGQVRDALELWTPASGLNEKSLNDDRVVHDADFDQISFKLSGSGPMSTIARLLSNCETTTLPLRVTKIVINPITEAKDYLNFELTVSTICPSEKDKSSRTRASAGIVLPRGDRL